jgi:hypothetical protein
VHFFIARSRVRIIFSLKLNGTVHFSPQGNLVSTSLPAR